MQMNVPFVNWSACTAHRSAASLTGVLASFKHSAIAGPTIVPCNMMAEGFAWNVSVTRNVKFR